MMKLISMRLCPYVQQVRMMLEAKKVPYEVEHIISENRPTKLMKASPDGGEVPVIITDEGDELFQSDSIVEYIDEVFGEPLIKGTPFEKAKDRAWARLAADNYLTQCSIQRSENEDELKEGLEDLTPIFEAVEKEMKEGPYFHGSELSMVDLSWLTILHRSELIKKYSAYDFLAEYPKLKKWREALLKTELAKASVPEDFEEMFKEFYLTNETYLGRLKNN